LVRKDRVWYLLASPDGEQVRTYRVDRIDAVEVTDVAAARPVDFDLAEQWRRVSELVERRRSGVSANVVVEQRHLWVLRDHFGKYLHVVGQLDGGRVEVTVAAHTA